MVENKIKSPKDLLHLGCWVQLSYAYEHSRSTEKWRYYSETYHGRKEPRIQLSPSDATGMPVDRYTEELKYYATDYPDIDSIWSSDKKVCIWKRGDKIKQPNIEIKTKYKIKKKGLDVW